MKQNRLWGRPWVTALSLGAMVTVSGVASYEVKRADLPTPLQLGTGWFFRITFAVIVFLVVYALVALLTATVRAGGPPSKMTGLGFSWEWDKAVEAATAGAESLEQLNERVSGLQEQLATLAAAERDTQEALVRIAEAVSVEPSVAAAARSRADRLTDLLAGDEGRAEKATEAIAAFRANLSTLERLHKEMSGA